MIPVKTLEEQRASDIKAMEFIQQVSKTKPYDWVTSMKDWDDRSTAEQELLALMLHFKVVNHALPDGEMWRQPEPNLPNGVIVLKNVHGKTLPYINDPNYFMIRNGKARKQFFKTMDTYESNKESNGDEPKTKVKRKNQPKDKISHTSKGKIRDKDIFVGATPRHPRQNMRDRNGRPKRERDGYRYRQRYWDI